MAVFKAVFLVIVYLLSNILKHNMLFFSFFKTLVGKEVAVEMKNDVVLTGTLVSVDQYLNVKLSGVNVVDSDRFPQLVSFRNAIAAYTRGLIIDNCSLSFPFHFAYDITTLKNLSGSNEELFC